MGPANVGSASLKERVLINLAFLHAPEIGAHVTLGEGGIGDVDTSDGDQTRVPIEVPGGEWSWHDDWHGRGYLSSYQITVLGMFQHCNTIYITFYKYLDRYPGGDCTSDIYVADMEKKAKL